MIIPSVDLRNTNAVQLEQGAELKIDAGDPRPIAAQFGLVNEIAVIDLDAALSTGSNKDTITGLLKLARCRVGGGIRDTDTAIDWLQAGAAKVILGTAATPDVLKHLPPERTIAALDARDGEVVVEGWTKGTGAKIADRIKELSPHVGGFLITFVEVEGMMTGLPIDRAAELKQLVGDRQLTVAGGIATPQEIGQLDALGIDAQVGMGLYSGSFDLADSLDACLTSDRPDNLWPTVVTDEFGVALGLAYSNPESLRAAINEQRGIYHSRSRGLWRKGDTSGDTQTLLAIDLDCDRDALRFTVRQNAAPEQPAAFCHRKTRTCWSQPTDHFGPGLQGLYRKLADPSTTADPSSYTARLLADPQLLAAKLREEAKELTDAADQDHVAAEAADVLYFTLATLIQRGVPLEHVEQHLDRRRLKVKRRKGDAKPGHLEAIAAERAKADKS